MVRTLAFTAEGTGSIPGGGTKIPQAAGHGPGVGVGEGGEERFKQFQMPPKATNPNKHIFIESGTKCVC